MGTDNSAQRQLHAAATLASPKPPRRVRRFVEEAVYHQGWERHAAHEWRKLRSVVEMSGLKLGSDVAEAADQTMGEGTRLVAWSLSRLQRVWVVALEGVLVRRRPPADRLDWLSLLSS